MKKKIKDLTVEQVVNICKSHSTCWSCPLSNTFCVFGTPQRIKLNKKVKIKDEIIK